MTAAPKRILFVDNRPEFMHQPVLRLRLEGYHVDEAESGDAGLQAIQRRSYDLLIFDAELPGGDGWEVLKRLREHPELGDTKVLVLMAAEGETGRLSMVPVDAELRRPFNIGQLLETVDKLLAE